MCKTTIRFILVLCVVLGLVLLTGASALPSRVEAATTALHAAPPFRCFRPFSALDKFAPSSMHRRDNCEFDYVQVERAHVDVDCEGRSANKDSDGNGTCYAVLDITFRTTDRSILDHKLPQDEHIDVQSGRVRPHYHPYYTVELHALNHSRITYKGFDGVGYDLCCDFLNRSAAQCTWGATPDDAHPQGNRVDGAAAEEAPLNPPKRQVLSYCAVTDEMTPAGSVVSGSLRKPLHRLIEGDWELKFTLRRGHETVGRLTVPFKVRAEDIAAATKEQPEYSGSGGDAGESVHEHHHTSAATTSTAVVSSRKVNEEDDRQETTKKDL